MKFVFFGSNQLSATVLGLLLQSGYVPELMVTVPDDSAGRKHIVVPPPLKQAYENKGLRFLQPASLKESAVFDELRSIGADLGIVAAYRKFIPENILKIFPQGVLNVHPSLLPKWRGPSPVQSAVWHGDTRTGVSIMLLDKEMDHGPVIAQEDLGIGPDEYFGELYGRLGVLGGELLVKTIPLWINNKIDPTPQDHSAATFSKMIGWQDGQIDCRKSVMEIYNQIRALSHEPGCWIEIGQKTNKLILKILKAKPVIDNESSVVKSGLAELNKQLVLGCKDGALELNQVQLQGKRPVSGREFINGYRSSLVS